MNMNVVRDVEDEPVDKMAMWWRSSITEIAPDVIRLRGYPIQDLIGNITFPAVVWLMTRGELPTAAQARLLEAVLVAGVDHGPLAPSLSIARMAATCGVGLNNAIASGVNVLGDVHGGAGEQCMEFLAGIEQALDTDSALQPAVSQALLEFQKKRGRYIPGFGHRFHRVDPRAVRIGKLLDAAIQEGVISGDIVRIARAVERYFEDSGRNVPMNIDGITAVVLLELGFPPPLGRGIFILSRSVGICAHAWEQTQQGGRIKGPVPKDCGFKYEGPPKRVIPGEWLA
ncbi:citryl-CoA lyase [Pusillimonas caeni]|uniref:citryl-CoA lyase n=1 Tax=Pusillimonas caeni TaxID=1348472 RepID=UPI000E599BD1|nr:citryl-CoA lyase [Pusillimonas caeni]TFL10207.1 citryl-CoA lyase [Pusillimonas caeni]